MKKIALFLGLGLSFATVYANAATPSWIQTVSVNNITGVVADITAKTAPGAFPIVFPAAIPSRKGVTYYANDTVNPNGYSIYIDSTATCNGVKYCNIFTMTVSKTTGPLPIYKNMQGQTMTVFADLGNGTTATYTPGFAMGDYWNPQVAWQDKTFTYTFSWVGVKSPDHTRKDMLKMVNNLQTFTPVKAVGNS